MAEERFLATDKESGEEGWSSEATAVIADIHPYVKEISISTALPRDSSGVYLNLQTKEDKMYTIEMSSAGFRIAGQKYDSIEPEADSGQNTNGIVYFETIYALLDVISPAYRHSFSTALADKLNQLIS